MSTWSSWSRTGCTQSYTATPYCRRRVWTSSPEDVQNWWLLLPISAAEKIRVQSDLATLFFAQQQKQLMEDYLSQAAVQDTRVPLMLQLPGIGLIGAVTILAAIGEITRFPAAQQLVGYAGTGGCGAR